MTQPNRPERGAPGGYEVPKPSTDVQRARPRTGPETSPFGPPAAADTPPGNVVHALSRQMAAARRRLGRIVAERGGGLAPDDAAAFQAAEIEAVRSAATVEPAPLRPRISPDVQTTTPAPAGDVASTVPDATEATAPPEPDRPPAAPAPAPTPIVNRLEAALAPRPEPLVPPAEDLAAAEEQPTLAANDAGGGSTVASVRRRQGATAPDHLLNVPASVSSAADDFFDGIVRRTTRDR